MELDDFKAHWNTIKHIELEQQHISPKKLEQIIMNATNTFDQLHAKSVYWRRTANAIVKMLAGILAVLCLILLTKSIYQHKLSDMLAPVAYLLVLVLFCIVTLWVYKRQEEIFTINSDGNVKDTIQQTLTAFNRFFRVMNIIYLFLYPAYYYSVIKLLMPYWHADMQSVFITCALATVASLAGGYWYYKVKFFKKLQSLKENLKDLEG
jgi:ABC-type multidrug transport system fused ATPase/permease subunit